MIYILLIFHIYTPESNALLCGYVYCILSYMYMYMVCMHAIVHGWPVVLCTGWWSFQALKATEPGDIYTFIYMIVYVCIYVMARSCDEIGCVYVVVHRQIHIISFSQYVHAYTCIYQICIDI
jgi:phosphatidylglycerophosphate synthase